MGISLDRVNQIAPSKPQSNGGGASPAPSSGISLTRINQILSPTPQPSSNPNSGYTNIGGVNYPSQSLVPTSSVMGGNKQSFISQAPQLGMWDKFTNWFRNTFTPDSDNNRVAAAQNAYAISKSTAGKNIMEQKAITLPQLAETGGQLFRNSPQEEISRELGIRNSATNSEFTNFLMTAAIGAGVLNAPLATIKTLGIFEGVNRVKSGIISAIQGEGFSLDSHKTLADFTPNSGYTTKTALDVLDFLGTGALTGGIYKATEKPLQAITDSFTKNVLQKYKLPESVSVYPKEIREGVFKGDSKVTEDFLKKTEIPGNQWASAVVKGEPITLPTERLGRVVNEPYWKELKTMIETQEKKTPASFTEVKPFDENATIKLDGQEKTTTEAKVPETGKVDGKVAETKGAKSEAKSEVPEVSKGETKVSQDELLKAEAKKHATVEEFEKKVLNSSNLSLDPRLQPIDINKITGTDYAELNAALKSNRKLSLKEAEDMVPATRAYKEGQQIKYPIEVLKSPDGEYHLQAGNHRLVQALVNGDTQILANVKNDRNGKSLADIFNEAKKESPPPAPEPKPSTKNILKTKQPEPKGTGEIKESRLYKRVKETLGAEYENQRVTYNELSLEKQAQKVVDVINKDPQQAMRVARGFEEPPAGTTQNAFSIGLAELARASGDFETASALWSKTSLRSTRLGQEIVSLRGSMNGDMPQNVVKGVVDARLAQIADKYKSTLENLDLPESASKAKKGLAVISEQAIKAQEQIKRREAQIKSITDVIDAITCK